MFKFDVNFEILKISITIDLKKKATNCVPVFLYHTRHSLKTKNELTLQNGADIVCTHVTSSATSRVVMQNSRRHIIKPASNFSIAYTVCEEHAKL